MADYTIAPARYAKGRMVVRPVLVSGYKTRACYLAEALGGRWVNRSHGYDMSPAAAEKLRILYEAGYSARIRVYRGSPIRFYHLDRPVTEMTAKEALAEAQTLAAKP